tara:strand:+ start:138 stop:323 length:186 start_codon:yes stop_codon:yes gene_type:complete
MTSNNIFVAPFTMERKIEYKKGKELKTYKSISQKNTRVSIARSNFTLKSNPLKNIICFSRE